MYRGLYDTREGLSPADLAAVGQMTALLLLPWNAWVHRRVERVAFVERDVTRHSFSMDFTLPDWFHDKRGTEPGEVKRQLVPLTFLRKGALINFSLSNEAARSIPLLNAAQNVQVGQALLGELAAGALGGAVPPQIHCDLTNLILQPRRQAAATYFRLLHLDTDPVAAERASLRASPVFAETARAFIDSFLGLP